METAKVEEAKTEDELVLEEAPEPEPLEVPTVEDLMSEILAEVPALRASEEGLRKVVTVFATYVGSEEVPIIPVGLEIALMEMELAHGWSAEDVAKAGSEVMATLGEALGEVQEEFLEATGTEVGPGDFEAYGRRFAEERREQASHRKTAKDLLEVVKMVSGQLGIPNPDPDLQPEVAPAEEKKGTLIGRIGETLLAGGKTSVGLFLELEDQVEVGEEDLGPPPSWTTLPVLNEGDHDLGLLKIAQARAASQGDARLIWPTLERLSLGREILPVVLERVAIKARDQLAQSNTIVSQVGAEYKRFSSQIGHIQDVQLIVLGVDDFLFPGDETEAYQGGYGIAGA